MRAWAAAALAVMCAVGPALASGAAASTAATTATTAITSTSTRIGLSLDGHVGAWLLLGPYRSASHGLKPGKGVTIPEALATDPPDVAEASLAPRYDVEGPAQAPVPPPRPGHPAAPTPRWLVASSAAGAIDVKSALKADPLATSTDLVAYAAGTLHLAKAAKLYMLLGSDDGVRVSVDGKVVFRHDESRPQRDDDDMVPLDLAAGDHPMLFKLHQRDGAWSFRVRFVDEKLAPPEGAWVELAGADAAKARELARDMARVHAELGTRVDAYVMHLRVRYSEGVPLGVALPVKAELDPPGAAAPLFQIDAGEVPVDGADVDVQLPAVTDEDLSAVEDKGPLELRAEVAGHASTHSFFPRRSIREAMRRADEIVARLSNGTRPSWLMPDSLESVESARDRLVAEQNRGDMDSEALTAETRELVASLDALEHDRDPYAARTGPMRMAYRSPVDGQLADYGLYVPPSYRPGTKRRFPLVVALHGLNGRPMAMMRWFFGGDDPKKEQDWEDRHVGPLPSLDAFVVTPTGYGNTMYRDLGEDDPMRVLDRVMARYPIDEDRVTITGPSMGGIGSAAIPFRYPDRFAAAAPLCGYHSYFVRRDFIGRPIRPWERALAEERSNVEWSLNGWGLPLFIVHGTRDLPVENSGVLIDAYDKMKYSVVHEHPDLGHNVWQTTYADLKGAKWLLGKRRDPHPRRVRFRTIRLRDGKAYWVRVGELSAPDAWGQVDARVRNKTEIVATTSGVDELAFDRDASLLDPSRPTQVVLDGAPLSFAPADPIVAHREAGAWKAGPATHAGPTKRGEITGPIRDAFHASLLFVYGASDPEQTRANEEVARAWAAIRGGVTVHYPVVSDVDFLARGESLANDHALFLVGNAKSNQVLRALESELPIRVDGDAVVMGSERFTGEQLGAAFVRPNPRRADRYLVVVEGTSALGTWRSLSLPDLLPDFVVYDSAVAPARGQMLLSAGMLRAAGFFKNDWSLPDKTEDPLAKAARPAAKSEYDATPYLP